MSNYVIHACPKRLWYVEEFLVPSLKEQGIENIDVRCDNFKRGNLLYCMDIFGRMTGDGGSWHIQDDVVICRDFAQRTAKYDGKNEIVCGFAWDKDPNIDKIDHVQQSDMWYSFPCIYIPNYIAKECSEWFFNKGRYDGRYLSFSVKGQFDDYFFQKYLMEYYPELPVLHIKPSLVDHIDYLIGGTTVEAIGRDEVSRAKWFDDPDLVNQLKERLKYRNG